MKIKLNAIYDGKVLQPEGHLNLKPNTRVRVIIEPEERENKEQTSFIDTAINLKLDGPYDWSAKLEECLYGRIDDAKE